MLNESKARLIALRNPISACCFFGFTLLTVISVQPSANAGTGTWKKNDGEWLQSSSWNATPANTYPGVLGDTANSDIATFNDVNVNPTNIGIGFTTGSPTLSLGTITVTSSSRFIGDSGSVNGTLRLNGTTIGADNVILNVTGGSLTIQQSILGGTGALSLALGSAGTSVINVAPTSSVAINTAVTNPTGTAQLTITGGGAVTLGGPMNSFAPSGLNLKAGTLTLGGDEKIANGTAINLNGGTLNTAGLSETVGALTLSANSTIALGAGTSTLTFSSLAAYTSGTLTITGWTGSPASGGTNGRIYFTSNVIDSAFLNNVVFSGFYGNAPGSEVILQSNGFYELVPVPEPTTIVGGLALAGLIGFRERRRFKFALQSVPGLRRLLSARV